MSFAEFSDRFYVWWVNSRMRESYKFNSRDKDLIDAAALLLKEIVAFEKLCPAKLVSVAKVQHVLSRLPLVTPDLTVTISVIGPRHNSDEVETWHYWDVAIEGERLSISSGGHYYCPSTGGDSFTTMNWSAVPDEPAFFEDYREQLWMVPDFQSFPEGIAAIDFSSSSYRIEILDPDNSLLSESEDGSDEHTPDQVPSDEFTDRPRRPDLISAAMSVQGGQIPLEHDSTLWRGMDSSPGQRECNPKSMGYDSGCRLDGVQARNRGPRQRKAGCP